MRFTLLAGLALALGACGKPAPESTQATAPAAAETNILLAEWTGPYSGTPAFDKMDISLAKDAMEIGMASNLAELDEIANNPEPATFENTILAMEKSGELLNRA